MDYRAAAAGDPDFLLLWLAHPQLSLSQWQLSKVKLPTLELRLLRKGQLALSHMQVAS